jgi:hypothetical protein
VILYISFWVVEMVRLGKFPSNIRFLFAFMLILALLMFATLSVISPEALIKIESIPLRLG